MRKIMIFTTYLLLVSFLISSCRTRKNNGRRNTDTFTLEQVYDSVYKFQYDYKTLTAKCNVKYTEKSKTITLKGNLRIQKDSVIWISLTAFGIEAVRLKCTKDSFFLIDKLKKSITKGKYEFLRKLWKIDVDYNSLESILTNHFFIYPTVADEKLDFSKQFSLKKDSNQIIVHRKTEESVENLLRFNNSDFRISSYLINDVPNVRSLKIDYERGDFDDAKNFPSRVDIASVNSGKNISLNLNYTRVTLNSDLSFPFRVPDSYKVVVH